MRTNPQPQAQGRCGSEPERNAVLAWLADGGCALDPTTALILERLAAGPGPVRTRALAELDERERARLDIRDLDLAESTVKIHVQHILRKLNLTSRVQAAAMGWIAAQGAAGVAAYVLLYVLACVVLVPGSVLFRSKGATQKSTHP